MAKFTKLSDRAETGIQAHWGKTALSHSSVLTPVNAEKANYEGSGCTLYAWHKEFAFYPEAKRTESSNEWQQNIIIDHEVKGSEITKTERKGEINVLMWPEIRVEQKSQRSRVT